MIEQGVYTVSLAVQLGLIPSDSHVVRYFNGFKFACSDLESQALIVQLDDTVFPPLAYYNRAVIFDRPLSKLSVEEIVEAFAPKNILEGDTYNLSFKKISVKLEEIYWWKNSRI